MQDIRIQLGRRVRELRKSMGWSQEALGERADLHPTYIGGIERGERNVALENLSKLASSFELSASELLDFPETGKNERKSMESSMIVLMRRQNIESLKFILRFLESFDDWARVALRKQRDRPDK